MSRPGGRIRADVKCVPSSCLANSRVIDRQFFPYTAIDDCSGWRCASVFDEHSAYSSAMFAEHPVRTFPCQIECIQTDKGTEFINHFTSSKDTPALFQAYLEKFGNRHRLIRPCTPRHNGKAERSHRKDNERFYATHAFYIF